MAYITAEEVKVIRNELKEAFPDFKFSVRKERHSAVIVTIVSGPLKFANGNEEMINHYHLYQYKHEPILKAMLAIINKKNYDNSDLQSDYFDVGFYVTLQQGGWQCPYVQTKFKNEKAEMAFRLKWNLIQTPL